MAGMVDDEMVVGTKNINSNNDIWMCNTTGNGFFDHPSYGNIQDISAGAYGSSQSVWIIAGGWVFVR